ncbi:MAG: hypothetical protein V7637_6303 [Mycobacteriales bacterium]|jgi:hypothetical protein
MFERMFEYLSMTTAAPERSGAARETRREARPRGAGDPLERALLPVLPALGPLFPDGALRRGSTVAVAGSTSLLIAVLAGPSLAGSWCAVLGVPALGLVAAAGAGVAVDRLALVPAPGPAWPSVTAALLDAVDLVVVAPAARVRPQDARRLAARARQRGSVLVPYGVPAGGWEGADLWLSVAETQWSGLGAGWGHLRARQALLRSDGRGSAGRLRRARVWLPAPDGGVEPVGEVVPIPGRRSPPGGPPPGGP